MNDTTITMSVHKRYDYTKIVIQSIVDSMDYCDINLPVLFSIDYHDDKIVDLVSGFSQKFISSDIIINKPAIGCNNNTLLAFTSGFENFDRIIHIEDDTVLSKDAIAFFIKHLDEYENDPEIFSISGYNKTLEMPTNETISEIEKVNHFTCWGVSLWKNKSKNILDNWIQNCDHRNKGKSWDSHINDEIVKKNPSMKQIRPIVSRIQNIGAVNGSWVPNAKWHFYNHRSPFTSNDLITI